MGLFVARILMEIFVAQTLFTESSDGSICSVNVINGKYLTKLLLASECYLLALVRDVQYLTSQINPYCGDLHDLLWKSFMTLIPVCSCAGVAVFQCWPYHLSSVRSSMGGFPHRRVAFLKK